MNKKFKNRNRGLVTFGIVALSAVALTASGFAAWVISGKDSQTAEGNIQVDTVENNNHTFAVTLSNENIVFGAVSEGASWLTNTDMAESLSTTASITVSNVTSDPTADISKILSVPTIKITNTAGDDVTATKYNIIADGTAYLRGICLLCAILLSLLLKYTRRHSCSYLQVDCFLPANFNGKR